MILHLVRKELRASRGTLAWLLLGQLVLLGLWIHDEHSRADAISRLRILRLELQIFAPLLGHALGQAFFTTELRSRTVLFLEGLPVSRAALVATKLGLATLIQLMFLGTTLVAVVVFAREIEPIDAHFFSILGLRTLGAGLGILGVTLLAAVLGRYRAPFYIALILMAFFYEQSGAKLLDSPPMSLIAETMMVDRGALPWLAFLVASGTYLASLALILLIFFVREGSVAVLLGERMSHAEKIVVTSVLLGITFIGAFAFDKRTKEPFRFTETGVVVQRGRRSEVQVQPGVSTSTAARAFASSLAPRLDVLAESLGIASLPVLFVVHRSELDSDRFEEASITKQEGVLLRGNYTALGFDSLDFSTFAAGALLDSHTRNRSQYEPHLWIRAGYPLWLTTESLVEGEGPIHDRLWMRALYDQPERIGLGVIDRWYSVEEQLGPRAAEALAWSILEAVKAAQGPEAVQRLARAVLAQRPAKTAYTSWQAGRQTMDALLAETTSLTRPELEAAWIAALHTQRARLAHRLALLPRLRGEITVQPSSALSRSIEYNASTTGAPNGRFVVLYSVLGVLDNRLEPGALDREDRDFESGARGRLYATFSAGSRVFVSFAQYLPELGCEVRSQAQRRILE